jgi:hypothetical protein
VRAALALREPSTGAILPRPSIARSRRFRAILLCLFLALLLGAEAAAPKIQNPVLVQAKKDLQARRFDAVIPALEALLASSPERLVVVDATLTLGQAYLDQADSLARAKDDAGASAVYDKDIALLEPFLESTQGRKTGEDKKAADAADKLLSQAYMSNADANIRLKNYDKALLSLQSFSSKYPERFDQANGRVKNIFAIREQYTKLASQIRDRALTSNGGDATIPALIEQLRGLDPYANKQILTTLVEVQTKVRDLSLLKTTMTEGRTRIDKGDFTGALETYVRGFAPDSTLPALFYSEFVNAGYDILERIDANSGLIVAMGEGGKLQVLTVDSSGRVLRTDANGKPVRGPGGAIFVTDAKGAPLVVPLRDFAGQRQIDRSQSVVAAVETIGRNAVAVSQGMAGPQGKSARLADSLTAVAAAFKAGDAAALGVLIPQAEKTFADFNADRLALADQNAALVAISQALPKTHTDGSLRSLLDYSYLSYAGFFLRGRQFVTDYDARDPQIDPLWRPETERNLAEGMTGALYAQASGLLETAQTAFQPLVDGTWKTALADWEAGRWKEAQAGFENFGVIEGRARAVLALWNGLGQGGAAAGLGAADQAQVAAKGADIAVLDNLAAIAESSARLAGIRVAMAELKARTGAFTASLAPDAPLAESLATLADFRAALRGYEEALAGEAALDPRLKAAADKAGAALVAFSKPAEAPPRELEAWRQRLALSQTEGRAEEVALVAFSQGLEVARLEARLAERLASVDAAAALTLGAPSTVAARVGLLDPSPTRSSATLQAEEPLLSELGAAARDLGARMAGEIAYVRDAPPVTPLAARDAALVKAVDALQTRRANLLADALAKQKTAAAALAAAQKSFADAEAQLAAAVDAMPVLARRPAARDGLEASTTAKETAYRRFLDAMNGDFDRATWDSVLARYDAIGRGINDARDQYAKLEVDRLLADAQHSYDLANFDASFDSLTKASALWKERYPTLTYQPLNFWLGLVGQARDTSNTRVIRQNDPLYREMTQYLSLARMKYEDGIALQKAAKTSAAKKSFADASSIIQNVTRTFPLNADAGFLSLQILKATNEADFKASLPNKISTAAELLKKDPARGYASIADLARIEPTNAQIARLLIQAEVATGKRKAEPTAVEKNRSLQLTDQARQLMKTGRQADLALAEQRLSDALDLDPNNRDAQTLSLNIQTLKGGGPDKILNVEDSRRLADARLYFSQGQYNQARDTLDALLAREATKTRDVLLLDAQLNQLNY